MAHLIMDKKDYIAYEGAVYTIEWYFDESGKSQAFDYLLELSLEMQQKVFYLIKRIGDNGKINDITKFRNEGDKIYAFKPQPDRFLSFFVKNKTIIITNAFRKKSDKLPGNEKTKALNYRKSYLLRVEEGKYYDKK
jgi:phage-related protein